jgi:hypothetical protein
MAMILRVFHGLAGPGGEDALLDAIGEYAAPTLERLPSLTGFQLGIRRGEAGEIVIVTTWTDFDAILANGDLLVDAPRSIGGAQSLFATSHADHYELVIGDERGGPIPDARMRVTNVTIKPGREAGYFQAAAPIAERLTASGMLMHLLGRRIVAEHTEVCAVTLWQGDAPDEARVAFEGPILPGTEDLSDFYAAPPVARLYEPILRGAAQRGSKV